MKLDSLNTLVDSFLTLAETRTNSQKPTFMKDCKTLLYGYIELSQLPLLEGKGKVSSDEAKAHAINEFKEFRLNFPAVGDDGDSQTKKMYIFWMFLLHRSPYDF